MINMDREKNIFKILRQIRGIEKSELAETLGVSIEDIDSVESGITQPNGTMLKDFASALGVTPNFIINRSTDKEHKDEKYEDYLLEVLQDIRRLNMKYSVQVKLPYTHSERPDQYALNFTEIMNPKKISFTLFADTAEEAKAYIAGRHDDGLPYEVVSVKWNTNLQSLRRKNGFTCKKLGELTGISPRQLQYLEGACGRINKTTLERAVKLATALNCHAEDLLDPLEPDENF